jgi:hypothetical protein
VTAAAIGGLMRLLGPGAGKPGPRPNAESLVAGE